MSHHDGEVGIELKGQMQSVLREDYAMPSNTGCMLMRGMQAQFSVEKNA